MDAVNLGRKIDVVKTSFPTKKKGGMKKQIDGMWGLGTWGPHRRQGRAPQPRSQVLASSQEGPQARRARLCSTQPLAERPADSAPEPAASPTYPGQGVLCAKSRRDPGRGGRVGHQVPDGQMVSTSVITQLSQRELKQMREK